MASRTSKTRSIIVILIIAVLAWVGGSLSCSPSNPSDSTPSPLNPTRQPQKVPDFTLPTMGGAPITLSELEGTPVVLVFWSTTCTYCNQELHSLEAVAQQNQGKIRVVAINTGESASRVQTFFGDYKPTMIIALDKNSETFVNYCQKYNNPRGYIPITFFINSDGTVEDVNLGATSETELRDILRSIL